MGNKAKEQSSLLEGMKHPFAEQWKACSTISLPFEQFQLCDVSLDHPVIDPPGKTGSHRLFVFLYSNGKGLEFGKVAALHLGQPWIEEFSPAAAQHLGKLLNQVIRQGEGSSMRRPQEFCDHRTGVVERGCHAHWHTTPDTLALPVLERAVRL